MDEILANNYITYPNRPGSNENKDDGMMNSPKYSS